MGAAGDNYYFEAPRTLSGENNFGLEFRIAVHSSSTAEYQQKRSRLIDDRHSILGDLNGVLYPRHDHVPRFKRTFLSPDYSAVCL